MKLLRYFFGLSRYHGELCRRSKGFFITGTIFNIIASILIFLFLTFGFACFNINLRFSSLGESIAGGLGGGIAVIVGIICILATVITVIKNIPHQILVAIVGFKRYKQEGATFLVCGIISILTLITLIAMNVLQFVGL